MKPEYNIIIPLGSLIIMGFRGIVEVKGNMPPKGHNCNLCKNKTYISRIGNVCTGEKFRGKPIEKDDTVCDEYEFGGFIELEESIYRLR